LFSKEDKMGLDTLAPYQLFEKQVKEHARELVNLITSLHAKGKVVYGYGASTKGNVLLQYCKLTTKELPCIAEVNEEKFGAYTPFTHIPIVSEKEAKSNKPDYLLVLPWHFRKGILEKETEYIAHGGKFIFPLPKIEIVG